MLARQTVSGASEIFFRPRCGTYATIIGASVSGSVPENPVEVLGQHQFSRRSIGGLDTNPVLKSQTDDAFDLGESGGEFGLLIV